MSGDKLARYQTFSENDLVEIDQQLDQIGGSMWFGKIPVGDTQIRIIPAPVSGGWRTFTAVAMHYVDPMPGIAEKLTFNCPNFHLKEPCVVCAEALRLASSKNIADKQLGKRLMRKSQTLCNILVRDNPLAGVKILGMGPMIWKKMRALLTSKAGGDMTDPTTGGYDVVINRVGTGQNDTVYDVWPVRQQLALADAPSERDEILAKQHDLTAQIDCQIPMDLIAAWGDVRNAGRDSARTQTRSSAVADARAAIDRSRQLAKPKTVVNVDSIETEGETVVAGGGDVYNADDPSTW